MCDHCTSGEAIVDAAITEGRIDASSRETFVRTFELSPDLVVATLQAAAPDVNRAGRNFATTLTEHEDAAYKADFARRAFVAVEEVL